MQNELLAQGLTLMALGMGVVFVFLALLVVTTYFMSAIIGRYFPQPSLPPATPPASPPPSGGEVDPRTFAIIREAIRKHRQS